MLEMDILSRRLAREKKARKEAELIAETKSRVLYQKNIELVEREHETNVLLEELKQQEKSLIVRHQILAAMMKYSLLEEVAPEILEIMCKALHFVESGLWKVDKNSNTLRCIYTWSIDNKEIKAFAEISKQVSFKMGIGLPGRVWETRSISWIKDVVLDPNFPRADYAKRASLHSAFALPILFEGEVLGVIEFFNQEFYPLDDSLRDMLNDITNQIGIYIEREEAQKKVTSLSRLAGMAEVASNVLHNVGNILNSVNISAEVILKKINHSKMENLLLLHELLEQHKEDLGTFMMEDPKGKLIPDFLLQLSNEWNNEKKYLMDEIKTLRKNIEHINIAIMAQQSLGQTFGLISEVNVKSLLEETLILNKITYEYAGIEVLCEFSQIQKVVTDRTKLFQIVVNLIKNSIEALVASNIATKQIILRLYEKDTYHFIIQVNDNGIGILSDNITKIFSHGFTTKKNGHGFGLHSCSIYARELGGHLSAKSEGVNAGATFTLELPYQAQINLG